MARTAQFQAWRAAMVALVLGGFLSALVDAIGPGTAGTFEIDAWPTETAREVVVLAVASPSAAFDAGIRSGQRLSLVDRSLFAFQTVRADETAQVRIAGNTNVITLHAVRSDPRLFDLLWAGIRALTLVVATVVAFSRPGLAAARALAVFLACIGLLSNWQTYPHPFALVGLVARQLSMIVGFPLFIMFAATFVNTAPAAFVHRYRRAAVVLGALFGAEVLVQQLLYMRGRLWRPLEILVSLTILAIFLVGLRAFVTRYVEATGETRRRILVVFATMFVSLSGAVTWLWLLTWPQPPPGMDYFALTTLFLPLGLGYAILVHRILDISRAIAATAVFTILTAVLSPIFALVEYLFVEIVTSSSKGTVTPIEEFFREPEHRWVVVAYAAMAVFSSMSFGWIHERLDHVCAHVLFRDRTEALGRVRDSARDVVFATDPQLLAEHLVRIVDKELSLGGSVVYLRRGEAFERRAGSIAEAPSSIDPNDTAVLRLKSSHDVVDLDGLHSTIPGTYAVRIGGGARVHGVLALDAGERGTLDADELTVTRDLVHAAGLAIEDITLRSYRSRIVALRRQVRILKSRTRQDAAAETTMPEV